MTLRAGDYNPTVFYISDEDFIYLSTSTHDVSMTARVEPGQRVRIIDWALHEGVMSTFPLEYIFHDFRQKAYSSNYRYIYLDYDEESYSFWVSLGFKFNGNSGIYTI